MTLTPTSEQDACAAVAEAASATTPLAIEGAGTKAAIGRPIQTERTLSSRALTGVTLYEPAEMVIAARAGTPLAEIERVLAEGGQHLTFEPVDHRPLLGSRGEPTIGAVAAANLSGPRRVHSGAARDSLIGVRFVNGRGEAIKSGGRVMKNVTGLDLVKGVAGSWGTLAFLTEVTFKVLPKPERTATLVLRGLDEHSASAVMSTALGSPYEITGAAHSPRDQGRGAQTLLRIEGFAQSVDYRSGELRRLFRRHDVDVVDAETSAALWRGIRDVSAFAGEGPETAVWRISTAPNRGHALAGNVLRHRPGRWFSDWGGGLVWFACSSEGDAGAAIVRTAVAETGGHATLVKAPADVRAAVDVFQPMSEPLRRITTGIKASFDPAGIFNPGRMYAGV